MKKLQPFERGVVCARRLLSGKPITSAWLRKEFGISYPQAKRDLNRIECFLPVKCSVERFGRVVLTLEAA